ncbi:Uracil-DNA glycosylase, family 4 [Minicystis rosea]|nr:Uracil-DNA glycosylase, family 4 [Minicystis rosea]
MELVSVCALRATSVLWQKGPASWVLTVVCKATFNLAPGESTLAEDQEAPNEADGHWDDDVSRSVYAPSDTAPLKVRADIVLVGSAFAPGGVPVRSLVARIVANKLDKSIECCADRVVARDGSIQEGSGFTRMPLVYERAAGGPGTSNPVGVRRDARDGYGRLTLPNLQAPGARVKGPEGLEPIGFGPLSPRWPQRAEKLGRYAASWSPRDWNTRPLPGDIDLAHFNVAPPDQQVPVLRDNERLVLENLHREHPRLMTSLPGIRPCAFVEGRTGAPFRLPMHADTLWIDSDRGIMTVTWRRQLPLDRPDEQGRVVLAMEQPGQTLSWSDVEARLHADSKPDPETIAPPPPSSERTSAALRVRPPSVTLPFASVESPTASTMQFAQPTPRAEIVGRDSALPFSSPPSSGPHSPPISSGASVLMSPPWAAKPPARSEPDSAVYAVGPSSAALPPAGAKPSSVTLPPAVAPPPPAGSLATSVTLPATPVAPLPTIAPPGIAPPPAITPPPAIPPPAAVAPPAIAPPAIAPPAAVAPPPAIESPWATGISGSAAAPPPPASATPFVGMAAASAAGVLAASTVAKEAWARPEPIKIAPVPVAAPAPVPAPSGGSEILELLWFDPESVPRIRRMREWKPILDALEQRPVDRDLDDPALASEPMEMEDRREVFEILVHAASTDAAGVDRTLFRGVRPDGKFVPQITLIVADLTFPFDELGTLKATVSTVGPLVTPADEALKAAVESAKEFLKTADELTPPSVAENMTARVREAWSQSKRTLPETHLEEQTDRVLLSQRRYQKRIVFGAPHLRCLARIDDAPPIPAYLPESLAKKLPMFQRFRGRLIAEVHQQADQYETHAAALRVVALARVTARKSEW